MCIFINKQTQTFRKQSKLYRKVPDKCRKGQQHTKGKRNEANPSWCSRRTAGHQLQQLLSFFLSWSKKRDRLLGFTFRSWEKKEEKGISQELDFSDRNSELYNDTFLFIKPLQSSVGKSKTAALTTNAFPQRQIHAILTWHSSRRLQK